MTRLPLVPELANGPSPLLAGQDPWQMGFGERAALVGLLSEIRPKVAIEIGTAEGGSLRRIAHHSERVLSFDLLEPDPALRELPNVEFFVGDSHRLLPEQLAKLSAEGTQGARSPVILTSLSSKSAKRSGSTGDSWIV